MCKRFDQTAPPRVVAAGSARSRSRPPRTPPAHRARRSSACPCHRGPRSSGNARGAAVLRGRCTRRAATAARAACQPLLREVVPPSGRNAYTSSCSYAEKHICRMPDMVCGRGDFRRHNGINCAPRTSPFPSAEIGVRVRLALCSRALLRITQL